MCPPISRSSPSTSFPSRVPGWWATVPSPTSIPHSPPGSMRSSFPTTRRGYSNTKKSPSRRQVHDSLLWKPSPSLRSTSSRCSTGASPCSSLDLLPAPQLLHLRHHIARLQLYCRTQHVFSAVAAAASLRRIQLRLFAVTDGEHFERDRDFAGCHAAASHANRRTKHSLLANLGCFEVGDIGKQDVIAALLSRFVEDGLPPLLVERDCVDIHVDDVLDQALPRR